MVQWVRLLSDTAGGGGSIPGQGSSTCHAVWPKKRKERYCRWNGTYLHEPEATILENEVEVSEGTCSWSVESRLWRKLRNWKWRARGQRAGMGFGECWEPALREEYDQHVARDPPAATPQECSADLLAVSELLVEFHLIQDYHDFMKVWRSLLRQFYQILKYLVLHSFPLKDELTGILKKLSLEKYQPIFEEQEVRIFFLSVHLNLSIKQLSKYVGCYSLSLDWSFSLRWLKK